MCHLHHFPGYLLSILYNQFYTGVSSQASRSQRAAYVMRTCGFVPDPLYFILKIRHILYDMLGEFAQVKRCNSLPVGTFRSGSAVRWWFWGEVTDHAEQMWNRRQGSAVFISAEWGFCCRAGPNVLPILEFLFLALCFRTKSTKRVNSQHISKMFRCFFQSSSPPAADGCPSSGS